MAITPAEKGGRDMSKKIGNVIIIQQEKPQQCDECGKIDELRPYGKNGACICFDCAMKNKKRTNHNMNIILFGDKGKLD